MLKSQRNTKNTIITCKKPTSSKSMKIQKSILEKAVKKAQVTSGT
jgi:hypothetical protein